MAYTKFTWATSSSLSVDHFNHLETQYAEGVTYATATLAPRVSPAFTGTPKVPDISVTVNSTQVATCKFVEDVLQNAL